MSSTSTVTEGELVARINRSLAKACKQLVGNRPGREFFDTTGHWYLVDRASNANLNYDVDPEALGRELGVLGDGEAVA